MQQQYLAGLIQLQQNLLATQIENGRLSMQRLEQENWTQHQSNQSTNYAQSRSPPPGPTTDARPDLRGARGSHGPTSEGAEELSKFNPLLASALARRQRRESTQSLPPPLSPSSSTGHGSTPLTPVNLTFQTQSLANSSSSSTAQYGGSAGSGRTSREDYVTKEELINSGRYKRDGSPTLSNTPSLVLSKPGEEFPKTASGNVSEEEGDSVGMSSYTPRPNRTTASSLRLAPSSLSSSPTSTTAPSPPIPTTTGATNGGRTTRFSPPTQQEYEEEVLHSDGSTTSSRSLSQTNSLEQSFSHASLLDNDSPDTSDKSASFENIQIAQLQQTKREEGRRALGRLGLGRPGSLNLARTRGVSEGGVGAHQYAMAMGSETGTNGGMGMGGQEHQRSNSESFASALSPFATTFSPPPLPPSLGSANPYLYSPYGLTTFPTPTTASHYPVFSTPNPFAAYLPSSPLPSTKAFVASGGTYAPNPMSNGGGGSKPNYRSTSSSGGPRIPGTASAIRQPIGPAAEMEFSSKNFSKRIRKNALGVLGRFGARASVGGAGPVVLAEVGVEDVVGESEEEECGN